MENNPFTLEIVFKQLLPVYAAIRTPVFALETGSTFMLDRPARPYVSSPNIYSHLVWLTGGSLTTIDINPQRSAAIKEFFEKHKAQNVSVVCADSVEYMQGLVDADAQQFNFFWLDSEENAEHGLAEYELAMKLGKRCAGHVICIDDYGSKESQKWKLSAGKLVAEASVNVTFDTPTGLIVGIYRNF